MQYQKLTDEQRQLLSWRIKRNAIVSKLLAKDPYLSRQDALQEANRRMRAAKGKK